MSDLCQLADVKSYLGISDTNSDTVLSALISQVSAGIESYCNRTFASQSYTERRNGGCGSKLYLMNGPVTAVASLTVNGQAVSAAPDDVSGGYVFDSSVLYIRPGGSGPQEFYKGVQNVTVTYTAGFTTIPLDVVHAAIAWVASLFAKRNRVDKKSETLGPQQTIGYDLSDMPAQTKRLLSSYIRWNSL